MQRASSLLLFSVSLCSLTAVSCQGDDVGQFNFDAGGTTGPMTGGSTGGSTPDDSVGTSGASTESETSPGEATSDSTTGPSGTTTTGHGYETDAESTDGTGSTGGTGEPCSLDADCDDGLHCNGYETCVDGVCEPGDPIVCDDGVECTVDSCDEAQQGACVSFADDGFCDDGLFCTGTETCDVFDGCMPGTPVVCDDGVACTEDICDEDMDACTFAADDGFCQDDSFCNGAESCDPVNGCQPGTPPACNDFLPCTTDSCDDGIGDCVHTPDDALCQNGLYCDGVEVCDAGMGCMPGPVVNCTDDGYSCTQESCNEAIDDCTTVLDNTLCQQGEFCTDGGCITGDPCDSDDDCDDGIACNGVETCNLDTDPGVCQPGSPVHCFDGIECTFDECLEPTGTCQFTPLDDICNDGNLCNGSESCDPGSGCVSGTPLQCDDGIACTNDSCFPAFGCHNAPDDVACQDSSVCNGAEVCDPISGCQPSSGPLQCPNDGIACTTSYCDEAFGGCVVEPNDDLCACGETCSVSLGCNDACSVAACDGQVYECGNCLDDDGDCDIDSNDIDCFGVCDNNESGFAGEIPGQNAAPCKMECYFDDDSGQGNDDCHWSHHCDPLEPNGCSYNPNHMIPGTSMSCDDAQAMQSQVCEDVCGPVVPNGCDCFGCCEVQLDGGGSVTVYLGTEVGNSGSCSFDVVTDPDLCNPCTQVDACLNPCEGCEICFGAGELPPECTEQTCDEAQPCGMPGQDPCPAGQFCLTGCCSSF